jgi:hypothetical protein
MVNKLTQIKNQINAFGGSWYAVCQRENNTTAVGTNFEKIR